MSGYTPAFSTLYTGTLYGRWPAAPVWASLLPLMDKNGHIEMTYEAISGMTGWPMDLLREGISQLCQPDPQSRSQEEGGRRLVLLDERRQWGWKAVNHALYRERARLQAKNEREVALGANATRMSNRRRPPETAGSKVRPPPTAADPLSNANADSEKNPSLRSGARARARRCPTDFEITEPMRLWAQSNYPGVDIETQSKLFRDHEYRDPKSDWAAAWRTWIARSVEYSRKPNGARADDTGWTPPKGDPKWDPDVKREGKR